MFVFRDFWWPYSSAFLMERYDYDNTCIQYYKRHSGTMAQWHNGTVAQWHSGTMAQWHSGTPSNKLVHNSFQCQAELKKTWQRYNLRNSGLSKLKRNNTNGTWNTMASYSTRARHSLRSMDSIEVYPDNHTIGVTTRLTPSPQCGEYFDEVRHGPDDASCEPLNPISTDMDMNKHDQEDEDIDMPIIVGCVSSKDTMKDDDSNV